jgi:hypothetical protein
VASWYRPGYIIGGGEESLSFLFPERTAQYYKFTWEEINTGGVQTIELSRYPLFYLLGVISKIGVPSDFLQIFIFFMLLVISGMFVYFLISESLKSRYAGTIGAIFYLLNPFMFASIWHRYLLAMMFMMALLPVSIYCLDRIIKTKNLIYLGFFLITNLILSSAFSLPSNIITYWVVLGVYIFSRSVNQLLGFYHATRVSKRFVGSGGSTFSLGGKILDNLSGFTQTISPVGSSFIMLNNDVGLCPRRFPEIVLKPSCCPSGLTFVILTR